MHLIGACLIEQMEAIVVSVVILFKPPHAALCHHPAQNGIYLN